MNKRFEDAALFLVDIQNDFCPGGALAVDEGDRIVSVVNRLMPEFPLVIAGLDWHPADHISFKERGGPWPPHCVRGTQGAELHPALDSGRIDMYFRKAATSDKDAYSEFEGADDKGRSPDDVLRRRGVERLYVAGLATDYCVKATVLDALKKGYKVFVITDAVRAVNVDPEDGEKALDEMAKAGAHLVTGEQVLRGSLAGGAAARN